MNKYLEEVKRILRNYVREDDSYKYSGYHSWSWTDTRRQIENLMKKYIEDTYHVESYEYKGMIYGPTAFVGFDEHQRDINGDEVYVEYSFHLLDKENYPYFGEDEDVDKFYTRFIDKNKLFHGEIKVGIKIS